MKNKKRNHNPASAGFFYPYDQYGQKTSHLQEIHREIIYYLGKNWEGWRFGEDGLLYCPMWRRGFDPHELRAMFYQVQQVRSLASRLRQLEKDLEVSRDQLERTERTAAFYRRQVTLESQLRMMLRSITA